MRDVNEQLAQYFDATVERMTAEDVLAGRRVRVDARLTTSRRRRALRPAVAVAIGFAVTIVAIAGTLVLGLALRGGGSEAGAGPLEVAEPGGGSAWAWAVGLAALAVIAVAALVRRRTAGTIGRVRDMTTTTERPMTAIEEQVDHLHKRNRMLAGAIVALVAAAVALGVWAVAQATEQSPVLPVIESVTADDPATIRADIERLLDDWFDASARDDAPAIRALYTPGATHRVGTDVLRDQALVDHLADPAWEGVRLTDALIVGEGSGVYLAALAAETAWTATPATTYEWILSFQIITLDGELRIAESAAFSLNQLSP